MPPPPLRVQNGCKQEDAELSDNDAIEKDEKPERPNANYRLSHENANPDEMTYHYNRERRLAKAPQAVRDLYKPQKQPRRFNLLGPLINTKPKVMTFASIVIACLAILAISIFGLASDTHDLDGNQLTVQAIKYEGIVIITAKKSVKKNMLRRIVKPYTGAVDIAVSPALKTGQKQVYRQEEIFLHRIFFTHEPQELYRFSVPFDSGELALVFQTEKKSLGITVKPE
jgi:hypothetical protein